MMSGMTLAVNYHLHNMSTKHDTSILPFPIIRRLGWALLLVLLALTPRTRADELSDLRVQVQALERKIDALEQKAAIGDAAAKTASQVTANDKGYTLASADGASSLKLRGLMQLDSRVFSGDSGLVNNSFVLRRARLFFEGSLARNVSFQLVPEFAGGTASAATVPSILDANFVFTVNQKFQLKIGKFKSPVGLEMLQSEQATSFVERTLVTNLVPNRDLGIQAGGELLNGTVNYTAGLFNGVPDGGSSTNADFDNDKEGVARFLASPFKNGGGSPVQGLSFGLAGSLGREKTTAGRTAGYKTDGQQTFFIYNAATVADGMSWRYSPQFDYRRGAFGLFGEYVVSTVNVRPSATGQKTELQNKAWELSTGYVLTGEASSYYGVVPRANFNLANRTWGAFEVVGRYSNLRVDRAAFPLYASASSNADEATAFGLGLNWYLAKSVVFKFDYLRSKFGFAPNAPDPSTNPVLRQDEKAFITRFQLCF
jgi:phosphate-selective porin OprO/OprP